MTRLHPNVNTTYGKNTDWDEVVKNITEDILKSLPEVFNMKKVKTFYGDKCTNPSIIILLQELEKFNALLDVMRNTLTQLSKVHQKHTFIYYFFAIVLFFKTTVQ
jgi:dynein heavy chain